MLYALISCCALSVFHTASAEPTSAEVSAWLRAERARASSGHDVLPTGLLYEWKRSEVPQYTAVERRQIEEDAKLHPQSPNQRVVSRLTLADAAGGKLTALHRVWLGSKGFRHSNSGTYEGPNSFADRAIGMRGPWTLTENAVALLNETDPSGVPASSRIRAAFVQDLRGMVTGSVEVLDDFGSDEPIVHVDGRMWTAVGQCRDNRWVQRILLSGHWSDESRRGFVDRVTVVSKTSGEPNDTRTYEGWSPVGDTWLASGSTVLLPELHVRVEVTGLSATPITELEVDRVTTPPAGTSADPLTVIDAVRGEVRLTRSMDTRSGANVEQLRTAAGVVEQPMYDVVKSSQTIRWRGWLLAGSVICLASATGWWLHRRGK